LNEVSQKRGRWPHASSLIKKKLDDVVGSLNASLKRHSGEGRNPVTSGYSGCRIKSGMTNLGLFTKPTMFGNIIRGEIMKENVLLSAGQMLTEIPRETWEQHLEQAPKDISKTLGFMTDVHHLIRNFVVRELPRAGKPLSPNLISEELDLSLSKTIEILDELEKNLFFLVRNEQGDVTWAFPVTVDKTPHRMTFSTCERINAA
jgi:hypothetical protein